MKALLLSGAAPLLRAKELERVQKVALRNILKEEYIDYDNPFDLCSLQKLVDRRNQLCYNFAKKCTKNPKTSDMFPLNLKSLNISSKKYRSSSLKYNPTY